MGGKHGWVVLRVVAVAVAVGAVSGTSCIIPDHGIVALVDCGARWCATAEHARALDEFDNPVDVQEPQPGGASDWVTECVCMIPSDDLVLRAEVPPMQYEILRNQVLDAARQACIEQAITNQLDPDPLPPDDALLDVTCTEAVTTIFRDGCCLRRNDECGTNETCDADLDGTADDGPGPSVTEGGESESGGLDSTGEGGGSSEGGGMSSLEGLYGEVQCDKVTCTVGPQLVEAVLTSPEAVLAEGTSFAVAWHDGRAMGLEVRGVEVGGLAWRLGLREGDVIVEVGGLPVTSEAEVMAVAAWAMGAQRVEVVIVREGVRIERVIVRE